MKVKMIFGPPGTGKTTRLLGVLEELLTRYKPEEIAFVSFTNEGVNQGTERAKEKFKLKTADMPFFRTLHSLAFRSLGLRKDGVITKRHYKHFSELMGMRFTGYYTEDIRNEDDTYLFMDDLIRNNPRTAGKLISMVDTIVLERVRKSYRKYKSANGIVDYTDMVEQFVHRQIHLPVKAAIVDEAQDLTTLQWKMVWLAFGGCEEVYIAGDDDQAIYQWSGADVDYFLKLEAEREILTHSYRLPNKVLAFASRITDMMEKRVEKQYEGTGKEGRVEKIGHLSDVDLTKGSGLILTRNNCYVDTPEQELRIRGLLYSRAGEMSISKEKVKLINLFTKLSAPRSHKKDTEMYELFKACGNKQPDFTRPWYDNFEWEPDDLSYYRDVIANHTNLDGCSIKLGTIHSSKGDEADNVILATGITRTVKNNLSKNPDAEHRVFYVGATRAKQNLYILYDGQRNEYTFY